MVSEEDSIDPALSVYFDLMRFFAAIIVVLNHYGVMLSLDRKTTFPGSDAVIVFFVLSGYVIAYVSDRKHLTAHRYIFDRLSRFWSVAVPSTILAIIIGFLVECQKNNFNYIIIKKIFFGSFLNLLFLGESWHQTFSPYNFPYWSINYEFWYYIIFGIWIFMKGNYRIPVVTFACILAGPSIMTFMPIWLTGSFLYKYRKKISIGNALSLLLFIGTIFGYWIIYHYKLNVYSRIWLKNISYGESYHLGPSTSIFSAYPLAVIVSLNFIAVQNLHFAKKQIIKLKKIAQKISSYTLTIYLFHMPLFYLFYSFGIGNNDVSGKVFLCVLSTVSVLIIAPRTEHRRIQWRNNLEKIWIIIKNMLWNKRISES